MKRILILQVCILAALASCTRESATPAPAGENGIVPIVFQAEGLDARVDTKTTPVTALNTFKVLCTKGTSGNETSVWYVDVTKSSNNYLTNQFWPNTDQTYHFYASNADMGYQQSGGYIKPANMDTDVVAAYKGSPTYKATNNLSFEHIFARVGTVRINAPTGYQVTNLNVSITPKVADGNVTIYTMATRTWSGGANGSATSISNTANMDISNDLWLLPGTYELTATYTMSRGEWVQSGITKAANVTLQMGKINNITATLPAGDASEIVFTVSVTEWAPQSVTATF